MKILYDHQCFTQQQYGGVSRYHYQLIKELNKLQEIEVNLSLKYSNNFYINEDKSFSTKKFYNFGLMYIVKKNMVSKTQLDLESVKSLKVNNA